MTTNITKPPKKQPSLRSAPKIRQIYWCEFPHDAQLPEFWKQRPVVVLSYRQTLYSTVTVVPCSSQEQGSNKWAYSLTTTIDGKPSWAICDKPTTVAVSRLTPHKGDIPRLTESEFNDMLKIVVDWLPAVREDIS